MHRHNERLRWRGVSESLVKQREHCRSLLEEHREALSETEATQRATQKEFDDTFFLNFGKRGELDGALKKLKRLGRYLAGSGRLLTHYARQGEESEVTGYSDSDWAGYRATGKSTSGGAIMIGTHLSSVTPGHRNT